MYVIQSTVQNFLHGCSLSSGRVWKSARGHGYRPQDWLADFSYRFHSILRQAPEDVAKGSSDRPVEDVIIVDCGEVRAQFFWPHRRSYLDP
jgi:hypothetical protein